MSDATIDKPELGLDDDGRGVVAAADASLLSPDQRRRVLSTFRLKLILTSFVLILLVGLSVMMFVLVTRIFDSLTPAVRADLGWKAARGAAELARATELGIVVSDERAIRSALGAYLTDPNVTSLVVTDRDGKRLVTHGTPPEEPFAGAPGRVNERETVLVAWADSAIEGKPVGRVAVVVSKARLLAGNRLKHDILGAAGGGCAVAFTICLFFVSFYVGPLIRVTRVAFERLEKTTAQALEATRLKSEFLANMSHEIRTPMNGIIGMTELLLATGLDSRQKRYGQTVQTSANALLNVLNDVLDFAKIEAGRLDIHVADCDAARTVEEVAELLSAQAQTKGLELAVHIGKGVPPLVRCDRERIRQILTKIAGNAVKFTEHGEVVLRLDHESAGVDAGTLIFRVDDSGPGIEKAQQTRLFEAFYQVGGSLTRKHGGTGLGLAISRQLVSMMGGRISLESEPGKGTRFRFEIPALRSDKTPIAEVKRWPSLAVLVVNDNQTNLAILEDLLGGWGMRVTTTTRAVEALKLLTTADAAGKPFELAIIDYQMPGMHGGELARRIRVELGLYALPIVMLASLGAGELGDCQKHIDESLTKPVRQSELRRALGLALADRRRDTPAALALDPTRVRSRRVVDLFLKLAPEQVEALLEAVTVGDLGRVRASAHKLQGSSLSIGAPRMARLCEELETHPMISGLAHEIVAALDDVERALTRQGAA